MEIVFTMREVVIVKLTVTGAIIWKVMVLLVDDSDSNYGHK